MKKMHIIIISLFLTACVVNDNGQVVPDTKRVFNRSTFLPLAGGLLGSLACYELFKNSGSKEGWTTACGVGGYLLASSYSSKTSKVLEKNRVGETTSWSDPDGRNYSMTPTDTYYQGDSPCRTYRSTVEIDGKLETLTGKACRQSDGTWKAI